MSVVILQFLIFVLPTLFFCKLRSGADSEVRYRSKLRLSVVTGDHVIFLAFAALSLILAGAVMKIGLSFLAPRISETVASAPVTAVSYMEVYTTEGAIDTIYAILTFAVLPAVCEEFLFRSVLAAEYEKSGVSCAVIMSAVMFAMLHFNMQMFLVYFVSGLILMLVMYTTRSVFGSMVVHILNNIFSIYFEDYIWKMLSSPQNTAIVVFILAALLLLFLIIMFSEAERIYHNYGVMNVTSSYADTASKKRKSGEPNSFVNALISPPFILLAIFFIIACAFI